MFAVIKTGGKQYKVSKGQVLVLEKLGCHKGTKVQFNEVLLLGGENNIVGAPVINDAGVQAEVLDQIRGPKVVSFVKRRRKSSSKRKKGHRQSLTVVKITDILASGAQKSGLDEAKGAGGSSEDFGNFSEPTVRKTTLSKKSAAKAEPVKKDTTKAEPVKKATTKAEPVKKATTKAEPVKKASAKAEPAKKGVAKAEPAKKDVAKAEPAKKDVAKAKLTKKASAKAKKD